MFLAEEHEYLVFEICFNKYRSERCGLHLHLQFIFFHHLLLKLQVQTLLGLVPSSFVLLEMYLQNTSCSESIPEQQLPQINNWI